MIWLTVIFWVIAAAVLLYLALSIFLGFLYPSLLLHPKEGKSKLTYEQVRNQQSAAGAVDYNAYDKLPKEAFTLACDGAELACEYIPATLTLSQGSRKKCIIRIHGFSQNKLMSVRFIKAFMDIGYAAVIYDQRCFGKSTGDACTMGLRESHDLRAVIDFVKKRLGDDTIIGVHGESMGSMTALLALGIDARIDFVVSDCGLSDFYQGTGYMIRNMTHISSFPALQLTYLQMKRHNVDIKEIRPIDQVAKTDKPILFLHGTADRTVSYSMSVEMFNVCKNPKSRLELFAGSDHGRCHSDDPVRYEKIVQEFVRAVENS
ncbi:MAG: alpha/beta hydrolase [Erysipelotrichaceae bacterium]|jgi:fermentation-respiration switch protein FrsA (DUF1100 family)|nr:alpha/beta hydrolase [Erysipelotrichaceae bacterium]